MRTYQLRISTPNGDVFNGEVVSLSVRGTEGDLAIMAGHIPFVTTVKPCDCKIEFPDDTSKMGAIGGGMLTVSKDNVILLSGDFAWKE